MPKAKTNCPPPAKSPATLAGRIAAAAGRADLDPELRSWLAKLAAGDAAAGKAKTAK